jgi:hypothetical protein
VFLEINEDFFLGYSREFGDDPERFAFIQKEFDRL